MTLTNYSDTTPDITIEYDVTQRTVRLIRWLRAHIYSEAHLGVSAARLARVWGC